MTEAAEISSTIKAAVLKKGDRVALLAPASRPASPQALARCVRVVEEMQLTPVVGKHVLNIKGSMAGTDGERAEDLSDAIADSSIQGIMFVSGGWGSLRLLERLDFDELSDNPKVIVGCDDNSSLLNAIHARTGLVVFNGPNLDQVRSRPLFERLRTAVMSGAMLAPINCSDDHDPFSTHWSPVDGNVFGKTVGGNLTALVSLVGTPYQPDFTNRLLFLEDVDEQNGILDRWLTNLYLAGLLQSTRGVAFGQFSFCGTKGSDNMLSIEDTFGDRLAMLAKPSCFGFRFGQTQDTAIVPLGVQANLDCMTGTLEFLEPAVV